MGIVGVGKEANGEVLVKSLASRPFWLERRVPSVPSMKAGSPIFSVFVSGERWILGMGSEVLVMQFLRL